eukprot:CAMPEP_0184485974 /NCGR_PEP_ID=MMETSP0113_2-20130426/7542_1 /TAXON_ID=91329 /ORGANISM="Norrisiella sphaerica, Strain BC52" /LENGTH=543 /DNA_ID=CAMNT_0026867661 /DNA_START=183 /DNA_END=1814 /DNA_ORIENTATION=-
MGKRKNKRRRVPSLVSNNGGAGGAKATNNNANANSKNKKPKRGGSAKRLTDFNSTRGDENIMISPKGVPESVQGCMLKVAPIPAGSIPQAVAIHFEDYGKIAMVQVFEKSTQNPTPYAHVVFESKAGADKALGGIGKKYLFPEIRGRRTRVTRVDEGGDLGPRGEIAVSGGFESDDDLLQEIGDSKGEGEKGGGEDGEEERGGDRGKGRKHRHKKQTEKEAIRKMLAKQSQVKKGIDTLTSLEAGKEVVTITDPRLMSRLLYPNPVCLLSVSPPGVAANVMTCSWLTPANNFGVFLLSINKRRHSALLLSRREGAEFVLSIPTHHIQDLVLNIGKKSGSRCDKIKELNIKTCAPGWRAGSGRTTQTKIKGKDKHHRSTSRSNASAQMSGGGNPFALLATLDEESGEGKEDKPEKEDSKVATIDPKDPNYELKRSIEALSGVKYGLTAIEACIAHLECHVEKMLEDFVDKSHYLVKAQIDKAYVRKSHWCGKNFRPRISGAGDILTFLGSQRFGYVGISTRSPSEKGSSEKLQSDANKHEVMPP